MRFSRQIVGVVCVYGGPTNLDCVCFLFKFEQLLQHSKASGRRPPRQESCAPRIQRLFVTLNSLPDPCCSLSSSST
jgi:hypothetical protein